MTVRRVKPSLDTMMLRQASSKSSSDSCGCAGCLARFRIAALRCRLQAAAAAATAAGRGGRAHAYLHMCMPLRERHRVDTRLEVPERRRLAEPLAREARRDPLGLQGIPIIPVTFMSSM